MRPNLASDELPGMRESPPSMNRALLKPDWHVRTWVLSYGLGLLALAAGLNCGNAGSARDGSLPPVQGGHSGSGGTLSTSTPYPTGGVTSSGGNAATGGVTTSPGGSGSGGLASGGVSESTGGTTTGGAIAASGGLSATGGSRSGGVSGGGGEIPEEGWPPAAMRPAATAWTPVRRAAVQRVAARPAGTQLEAARAVVRALAVRPQASARMARCC